MVYWLIHHLFKYGQFMHQFKTRSKLIIFLHGRGNGTQRKLFTCNFITKLENAIIIISMKDTKKYKVKEYGMMFPLFLFEIIFSLETLFTPLEMHMSI